MKKVLLSALLMLGLVSSSHAQFNIDVAHNDSVRVADTLGVRTDTLFSEVFDIRQNVRWMNFAVQIITSDDDSNFIDDTLIAKLQTSTAPDGKGAPWVTHGTVIQLIEMTSVDIDTAVNSALVFDSDASFRGQHARVMFIYSDELLATEGADAIASNPFPRTYRLWITSIGAK